MATYPSFPQMLGSVVEDVDDLTPDRAVNGDVHVRAFFDGPKKKFTIKHWLIVADLETLDAFYNANRLLAVTFTWALTGVTYTCLFGAPIKRTVSTPLNVDVEVVLLEQ